MINIDFDRVKPERKKYNSYNDELIVIYNKYINRPLDLSLNDPLYYLKNEIRSLIEYISNEERILERDKPFFDICIKSDKSNLSNVSIIPENLFTACILLHKYVPYDFITNEKYYSYTDGTVIKLENGYYVKNIEFNFNQDGR